MTDVGGRALLTVGGTTLRQLVLGSRKPAEKGTGRELVSSLPQSPASVPASVPASSSCASFAAWIVIRNCKRSRSFLALSWFWSVFFFFSSQQTATEIFVTDAGFQCSSAFSLPFRGFLRWLSSPQVDFVSTAKAVELLVCVLAGRVC